MAGWFVSQRAHGESMQFLELRLAKEKFLSERERRAKLPAPSQSPETAAEATPRGESRGGCGSAIHQCLRQLSGARGRSAHDGPTLRANAADLAEPPARRPGPPTQELAATERAPLAAQLVPGLAPTPRRCPRLPAPARVLRWQASYEPTRTNWSAAGQRHRTP